MLRPRRQQWLHFRPHVIRQPKAVIANRPFTNKLVSCDFNYVATSSTFDANLTAVVDGALLWVLSWLDNEWGFSKTACRTPQLIGATCRGSSHCLPDIERRGCGGHLQYVITALPVG
jgi:hypothetical protein